MAVGLQQSIGNCGGLIVSGFEIPSVEIQMYRNLILPPLLPGWSNLQVACEWTVCPRPRSLPRGYLCCLLRKLCHVAVVEVAQ